MKYNDLPCAKSKQLASERVEMASSSSRGLHAHAVLDVAKPKRYGRIGMRTSKPRRIAARRARKIGSRHPTADLPFRIQLWVRLTLPGIGLIGPGKIQLLRLIQQRESISAAARTMRMSYRRAWLLVDELNGLFENSLVEKWFGGKARGGAKLTSTGQELLQTYDAVVERADHATRELLKGLSLRVRLRKGVLRHSRTR